ncbi:MAG TPA: hypothetical protein PL024_00345 [Thauera sp.]|nr:hypothetical protein [Thauera sp.]
MKAARASIRNNANGGAQPQTPFSRTLRSFWGMLPVLLGTLLLSSLILAWLPRTPLPGWFGRSELLDVLLGASLGSIAMGHPVAGYLLGGELLAGGISLVAVSALIVAWVTVGVVQLPAEALALGHAFALRRNLLCFLSAIAVAWLTVMTMRLGG